MKSSVFSRRFVLFFIIACLGWCLPINGQLPADPASLFSGDALMFIDIPNAGDKLVDLKKHYYDVFYRPAIDSQRLKPLELPFGAPLRADSKQHWLLDVMRCFKQSDNRLIKELKNLTKPLGNRNPELSREEEDSIVANFAKMFPGRIVIAIEDKKSGFAGAFGIEFDPDVFDWYEELNLVADSQPESTKKFDAETGITISYSPVDEVYFFKFRNVLYGVCDSESALCEKLARRVVGLAKYKSLHKSRYFQRVVSQLGSTYSPSNDIFCYVRFPELLERRMIGYRDPAPEIPRPGFPVVETIGNFPMPQKQVSRLKELYGANCMGLSLRFGHADNEFEFEVVYPLLQPIDQVFKKMLESLKTIEVDLERFVLRGMTSSVFVEHGELELPMPFESGNYFVGAELFPKYWHFKSNAPSSDQLGFGNEQNKRIPNPCSFSRNAKGEICKYSLSLYPESIIFMDELADNDQFQGGITQVNGFLFPPHVFCSEEELKEGTESMFQSKAFRRFKDTIGKGQSRVPSEHFINDDELTEFGFLETGEIRNNEMQFKRSSFGPLKFVTAELADGVLLFRDPGYEDGLKRLTQRISSGKRVNFNVKDWFSGGRFSNGDLKGVVVQRSFSQRPIFEEVASPVFYAFHSWRHGQYFPTAFGNYQRRLLTTEHSALLKAARHLSLELFSSSISQVRFGALPINFEPNNLLSIYCLVVPKSADGFHYHGLFRYAK